jgi:ATP-binding cassette subfamily B protein
LFDEEGAENSMIQEAVPCEVKELLEKQELNGVPVLLSAASDLSLNGEVRSHWVVATRENLAVVADGAEPTLVNHLPIRRIEKFRAHGAVGSGFLQAYVDEAWVDVARFSNAMSSKFHKLAGKLEDLRASGEVVVHPEDQDDSSHCPKCGLRLPTPGESCPRCLPRMAIAGRLWQLVRPQWPTALAMSALMLLGVALELAPPKLQQYLVDEILAKGEAAPGARSLMATLLLIVLALAVTRVLLGVVNWVKGLQANKVGVELTFELRSQLVRKLHAFGVAYYDRHPVGSLVSRVAYDSEVLHTLLQQITGGFLLQIFQVAAVGFMLFTLNPKLALFTMIPAPLVVGGSLFFWRRVYPKYYRYWDSSSKQAGTLSGMLSGIRVVKAFAQEPREFDRFHRSSEYLRRSRITVEKSTASFSAIMGLVFSLGGLIVWYVGGRDVLAGKMTLGSLMAFLAYLAMFYAPLSTLSQLTTWLTSFMTGCQRVFELLDTPTETCEAARPEPLPQSRGEIRFENVTFGYERHRPVLKEVDFTIRPGEKIGIVGRSGSGKTTLVNLISRFYDVEAGRILLDGVDMRELAMRDLRRQVGVVLQEPFLFRGTICDNLVYGRPEATAEDAITAARAAQAHDFILRTPLGYDTWLGERGAGLSGGERQRVSIARALLYDPKVLILDEATSSVDTESEKAIQEALRVLVRGRTTLAIAHRLSTLRDSDRIFVFDQGRLAEQGTHNELMRLDGKYAKLVKIQSQISRNAQFEAALNELDKTPQEPESDLIAGNQPEEADFAPLWLEPDAAIFREGPLKSLEVELPEGKVHRSVFAVQCFPATRRNDFISLRSWDRDGHEHELGIVRHLEEWSPGTRELMHAALGRRYYLRRITGIDEIELDYGMLNFRVTTDHGPAHFTMRWNQSQAHDFGERGKVLLDTEDNRFLVTDTDELPKRQRELFQRYVYW